GLWSSLSRNGLVLVTCFSECMQPTSETAGPFSCDAMDRSSHSLQTTNRTIRTNARGLNLQAVTLKKWGTAFGALMDLSPSLELSGT
ncbi:protein phosphatase 2C domain-containing protein, partial [Toxoplasma gondii ARI]